MADRTVYIESAGGTYDGLNHAFTDEVALTPNLITDLDGILTFQCGNFEDATPATTGTGWTADASHYLNTIGDPADQVAGETGKWSTARYRIVIASGIAFTNQENFTRLSDLQAANGGNSSTDIGYRVASAEYGQVFERCLVYFTHATPDANSLGFARNDTSAESAAIYVINCIAVRAGHGFYLRGNTSGYGIHTYSCTAYGCGTGFRARSSYCYAKNCVAVGCTDAFLETSAYATADYCAYDEGTDPGSNGVDVSGYTDDELFVDADNATVLSKDLHLAAGSALIGAGVDTSGEGAPLNFTDDIDGDTRSTWDIGADEYVAAGGGRPLPHRLFGGPFIGPLKGAFA